jgi:hypothetical protein
MPTEIVDIRPILLREIGAPEPATIDATPAQLDGYIKDGFWHLRLNAIMAGYSQDDGQGLTPPTTGDAIYLTSDEGAVPEELQRLVALSGGFRMIRLKILALAVNFTAKAGPAEYEQQASATTLRRILDSLERELAQLSNLYSTELGQAGFYYMDGLFQAEVSELQGLPQLAVII